MSEHTVDGRTPEEAALTEKIEHTRQQLGETVEALAAKTDVKGRAQQRAAAAGRAVRDITPALVQRSAGEAVVIVRRHREKAATAVAAATVLLFGWLVVRRRRR